MDYILKLILDNAKDILLMKRIVRMRITVKGRGWNTDTKNVKIIYGNVDILYCKMHYRRLEGSYQLNPFDHDMSPSLDDSTDTFVKIDNRENIIMISSRSPSDGSIIDIRLNTVDHYYGIIGRYTGYNHRDITSDEYHCFNINGTCVAITHYRSNEYMIVCNMDRSNTSFFMYPNNWMYSDRYYTKDEQQAMNRFIEFKRKQ